MKTACALIATAAALLGTAALGEEGAKNPVVVVETSLGNFEIELYQDKAPITVKNFLDYVADKHYDGTIFHRVINGFMIQGGGFTQDGTQKKTKASIKNESGNGVKNIEYAVAMARTQALDSATSQFFINVKNNSFLDDNQYCAFGMVVSGKETVDKIKVVPTKLGPLTGNEKATPVDPVVIKSVQLKK